MQKLYPLLQQSAEKPQGLLPGESSPSHHHVGHIARSDEPRKKEGIVYRLVLSEKTGRKEHSGKEGAATSSKAGVERKPGQMMMHEQAAQQQPLSGKMG